MVKDYSTIEKIKVFKKEKKAFRREARKQVENVRYLIKYRMVEQPGSTPLERAFLHLMQEVQESRRSAKRN